MTRPTWQANYAATRQLSLGETCVRAGVATYFDRYGRLQLAAANQPRFDYDPVTNACKGLLIEESRINYVSNSSATGASAGVAPTNWGMQVAQVNGVAANVVGTVVESGVTCVVVNVSGTYTGTTGTWANMSFNFGSGILIANGGSLALSSYVSLDSGDLTGATIGYRVAIRDSSSAAIAGATYDILNFVPTKSSILANRFVGTRTETNPAAASAAFYLRVALINGVAYNFTLRIALPQAEPGLFATSPIPTISAAVTRAADLVTALLGPWFEATQGTLCAEYFVGGGTGQRPVQIDSGLGNDNNRIAVFDNGAGPRGYIVNNSVIQRDTSLSSGSQSPRKMAFSYQDGSILAANGTLGTFGSHTTPAGLNTLRIGSSASSVATGQMWVRRLAYYKTRLSNTELQQLTL